MLYIKLLLSSVIFQQNGRTLSLDDYQRTAIEAPKPLAPRHRSNSTTDEPRIGLAKPNMQRSQSCQQLARKCHRVQSAPTFSHSCSVPVQFEEREETEEPRSLSQLIAVLANCRTRRPKAIACHCQEEEVKPMALNVQFTLSPVPVETDHIQHLACAKLATEIESPLLMPFDPELELDAVEPDYKSKLLDNFELRSELGSGAFGVVYEAVSKIESQSYAVKLIPFNDSNKIKSFREALSMSVLYPHPNIVRYFSSWTEPITDDIQPLIEKIVRLDCEDEESEDEQPEIFRSASATATATPNMLLHDYDSSLGDTIASPLMDSIDVRSIENASMALNQNMYSSADCSILSTDSLSLSEQERSQKVLVIQMDICHGNTLKQWLVERGQVNYMQSLNVFKQIVIAIDHIHQSGILHRDIKPENIFLCQPDEDEDEVTIKLGDFGLSVTPNCESKLDIENSNLDQNILTAGIGTVVYAAPEQLDRISGSYSCSADIYPLGLILYELMYKFDTAMERAVHFQDAKHANIKAKNKFKDPKIAQLIIDILNGDASKRPTAQSILAVVHELLQNSSNSNSGSVTPVAHGASVSDKNLHGSPDSELKVKEIIRCKDLEHKLQIDVLRQHILKLEQKVQLLSLSSASVANANADN